MKKTAILFVFLSLAVSNANALEKSIGLGAGFMYSGLGANFSLHDNKAIYYAGLGCPAMAGSEGIRQFACGVGAGATFAIPSNTNKHGLGLYLGAMSAYFAFDDSNAFENARYGTAATYTYFYNGVNNPGFNVGVSPLAFYYHKSAVHWTGMLSLGYQFGM